MSAASAQTFDELFALEEMDAFLKKAQEKCRAKVGHQKFAGMETDDVVQEVLIKVYRSMQRYDGTLSKVSTYVDHVMDNMIRDCLRKAGSKSNLSLVNALDLLESTADPERCNSDGQDVSWSYIAGCSEPGYERMELITDVMENMHLNKREQEVFRLRLTGYEFMEIAEKIGVSKARVSQIWKSIREKYVSL